MENMLNIINLKRSRQAWSPNMLIIICLIFSALMLAGTSVPLQAQSQVYPKPSLWFGVAGGANFNFYRGTTQELNSDLTVPTAFRHGNGIGLYVAPSLEYYRPDSKWGVILQVGYDSRKGTFETVITPCNCPADLETSLSYITIEPSLRFAPFNSGFYIFGGPRLAFNLSNDFTYQLGVNPAISDQPLPPVIKGTFSNTEKIQFSGQVGAGYDIYLSSEYEQTQFVVSPFASFHPYFGQTPRSIETWNNSTVRVGATIKFGRSRDIATPAKGVSDVVAAPKSEFSVVSPPNLPVERRVNETFPILNYVFFDLGSTEIPERYVILRKDQVKDFKEDQLEVFTPKSLTGRSARQLVAYYNLLNILGDRMGKNPSSTVTLVGSSEKGADDAKLLAGSVRDYLVNIFGIDASRISIQGLDKAKIPSEQVGSTMELDLLREEDRRVSIESKSPSLLMEFQSGPDAMLKPVKFETTQVAPLDSYITFNNKGAEEAFQSWSVEVEDDKTGKIQHFGPYKYETISIPGKTILGTQPKGDYKVTMVGKTHNGRTIRKSTSVHMVLWKPDTEEQGKRYSVIFGYNNSRSIALYEKYLSDIVAPQIPKEGVVVVHGYTDVIGEVSNNRELSYARAKDVKKILSASLEKAGRSDVTFRMFAFGEDQDLSQFENKLPEERFYNRTVIIDIYPK